MPGDLFSQWPIRPFSMEGVQTRARVLSLYDGDTLTMALPVGDVAYSFKCRLAGIDTCELKSSSPAAKELAMQARRRLLQLVSGGGLTEWVSKKVSDSYFQQHMCLVYVTCYGFDMYGRVLLDVYPDTQATRSCSQTLLDEHLAYGYSGGTKLTEEEQIARLMP